MWCEQALFSPDPTGELQPLLSSAIGGLPWCLLLVGLLMMVIAGKSITANRALGKHRETAPCAVPKAALRLKTAVQQAWAQWWNTGVGCGRPKSWFQLYHRFPVGACLPAATDFLFCDPGQITPAHLARVIHRGLEDTLRCLIKRQNWSLGPDNGWLFPAAKVKIKTQRRSCWSQKNSFLLVDQKKWKNKCMLLEQNISCWVSGYKKTRKQKAPHALFWAKSVTFWQGEDFLLVVCSQISGSVIEMGTERNFPGSWVLLSKGLPDIISWFSSSVLLKYLAYLPVWARAIYSTAAGREENVAKATDWLAFVTKPTCCGSWGGSVATHKKI